LAVGCFFCCLCPFIIYSGVHLASCRHAIVWEAIFVISSVVKHVCLFELDIQLCDIFLEKFDSVSRRNENNKGFPTTRY
jgi:hypothetical protein